MKILKVKIKAEGPKQQWQHHVKTASSSILIHKKTDGDTHSWASPLHRGVQTAAAADWSTITSPYCCACTNTTAIASSYSCGKAIEEQNVNKKSRSLYSHCKTFDNKACNLNPSNLKFIIVGIPRYFCALWSKSTLTKPMQGIHFRLQFKIFTVTCSDDEVFMRLCHPKRAVLSVFKENS